MRTSISESPYSSAAWPCRWIALSDAPLPFVGALRRRFEIEEAATIRVHVSADERYELFLDGARIGRGPERGDAHEWFFETYDLELAAGMHTLVARVWALGQQAPYAQISVAPGFLLSPEGEAAIALLGTGVAAWEAKVLGGYEFTSSLAAWGTGARVCLQGDEFSWGFERGEGEGWAPAAPQNELIGALDRHGHTPAHHLVPATLPPMRNQPFRGGQVRHVAAFENLPTHPIPIRAAEHLANEAAGWEKLLRGEAPLPVPAYTRRRVLVDLRDYLCAYPEVVTSGGRDALVRLHWAEALYVDGDTVKNKGQRDEIEGKFFVNHQSDRDGIGDEFRPDGGSKRRFETLWWECGRYMEIVVQTATDSLTIETLTLHETRYPLERDTRFACEDARLEAAAPLMVRALQMCSHETYMDCPYYEQLMYIGDTRLQALATYALTRDGALPRKALRMFDASRGLDGLTQSRYPSRVRQIIPPFSLWHIAMLHDFALWRDDAPFVRALLPGVRGICDHFARLMDERGLIRAPEGWNYMDWVVAAPGQANGQGASAWKNGVPPDGATGISGVLCWQIALAFRLAGELEAWHGEPELAALQARRSQKVAQGTISAFWNEERGLFADDLAHCNWSEHAQCLALLSGYVDARRERLESGLLQSSDLARATIYFSHYVFEALRLLDRPDALLQRLGEWFALRQQGFVTTPEQPEPSRSDCHAWGAHPLFHFGATILGVRPAAPGFSSVEIAPQLGPLQWAQGTIPHPRGEIVVAFQRDGAGLRGSITLPEGITGTVRVGENTVLLREGEQSVAFG